MGVLVEVVNSLGVQRRRTPLDAVDLVALFKQELRKVGAILASYARYQCFFLFYLFLCFNLSQWLPACALPNSLTAQTARMAFSKKVTRDLNVLLSFTTSLLCATLFYALEKSCWTARNLKTSGRIKRWHCFISVKPHWRPMFI